MTSHYVLSLQKPRKCKACGKTFLPYKSKGGLWYRKKCLPCKKELSRKRFQERKNE